MKKIFQKAVEVLRGTDIIRNREAWTWHRFMIFFFSVRGQKRVLNFVIRTYKFLLRSLFGGKQVEEQLYQKWIRKRMPGEKQFRSYENDVSQWHEKPLISVIMPVYRPDIEHLKQAVLSVQSQIYPNWELCICDDASQLPEIKSYLDKLAAEESRIRLNFREENGHISDSSNDALKLASGKYCAFLDQDDLLTKDALYQVAKVVVENPETGLIYSDEDKIDETETFVLPHFKPDFAPHNLLSRNYFGHLVVARTDLIKRVGGFRKGMEGSQDYDLWLRITEQTEHIVHIPKILYHWRMHEQSTARSENVKNYAFDNGVKALNEALKRRNITGRATLLDGTPGVYRIKYELSEKPLVSIIIPTKDNAAVLDVCLSSVFRLTDYSNYEVILVDNNSSEKATFDLLESWKEKRPNQFRVLKQAYPFNFSKLMNGAAAVAKGEYLLLLNNDTEVIHEDWMRIMLEHAVRPEIGAVGVKLLFPDDSVQHAGVVIGIGSVAGHTFVAADRNEPGYYYYLKAVSDYSAVTGACLMVSASKYKEVGGFDEELAVEYNDVDFCLKLFEKGYYNVFVPDVVLYHYESLTRGHPHANRKVYKRHMKEVRHFKKSWDHFIQNDPLYNPNLTRLSTYFEPNING